MPHAFSLIHLPHFLKLSFFIFKTYLYLSINQLCGQLTNYWLNKFANTWLDLWTSFSLELDKGYFKVSSKNFWYLLLPCFSCLCFTSFSFNFILLSTFVPYEFIILLVHPTNLPLISHRVVTTKPSLVQLLRIVLFVILEFIFLVGNSQH